MSAVAFLNGWILNRSYRTFGFVLSPLSRKISFICRVWVFGPIYCRVNNYVSYMTVSLNVFTLLAISVDRRKVRAERSHLVLQYIRQRYFITAGYLIYRPLIHWGYRRQDSLHVWDSQAQVTCQESEALSDIIQCPFYFNLDKARALYLCIRKCYFNGSSLLKDSNERG